MTEQRITVLSKTTLLGGWSKVIRVVYEQLRRDGRRLTLDRDMLDRGDGVAVLLYNTARGTVLLLKQARVIATLRGMPSSQTLEVCNGLIEPGDEPLACALREVEEETGHRLQVLESIAVVYASPGASLELVHLFLGEYTDATRVAEGGGLEEEGEDIEVVEVSFAQALQWIADGTIRDGRSILVLQQAAIRGVL
jgi:nudix-type nucleoside diphosphatase (YffH/AdpP family)